jgi:redox-sensing transcriptional repressor
VKRIKVSNNVIRRMPRYLRKLDDLNAAGIERISSGELGRQMGLTPSQIRQDFSCFGEFGQQGYGYNVVALRGEVAKILGMDRNYTAVLVGVGNIGRALVEGDGYAPDTGCKNQSHQQRRQIQQIPSQDQRQSL